MRRTVFTLAAFVAVATAALWSQGAATQATKPPTGVVAGQLVDASSGAPVSNAVVTIRSTAPQVEQGGARPPVAPTRVEVLTDGNGRFVFYSLPASSFFLSAYRQGYLTTAFGQTQPPNSFFGSGSGDRLTLTDGQRLTNVSLKIWKYGSISGRLTDEVGEPAIGATVWAVSVNGVVSDQWTGGAQTDDRGMFRFSELSPGRYIVMFPVSIGSTPLQVIDNYAESRQSPATMPPMPMETRALGNSLNGTGLKLGNQVVSNRQGEGMPQLMIDATGKMTVYPVTFYPGTRSRSSATLITLESGQDRTGTDFVVRPVPAATVTGRVVSSNYPVGDLVVRFLPVGMEGFFQSPGQGSEVSTTMTAADGSFTAVGVPSGNYTATIVRTPPVLRSTPVPATPESVINTGGGGTSSMSRTTSTVLPSTEPMLWGRAAVSVGDTNINDVVITLARGATVSGRVEFESGGPAPTPAPQVVQGIRVLLNSVTETTINSGNVPRVSADGSFTTVGYPAGRYYVIPSSIPGWTPKAVMIGGRNMLFLPLDLSADLTNVVITYTDKTSEITGNVSGTASTAAIVFALPADYQSWIKLGMDRRIVRPAEVAKDGSFQMPAVLAGDYLLVAAKMDLMQQAFLDPQVMTTIARQGVRVTVAERDKRSVALTLAQGR